VSLAKALQLALDQVNGSRGKFEKAYWVVDEGVVMVATGSALDATMKTRTLDISDLLLTAPSVPRPSMGGASPGGSGGARGGQSADGGRYGGRGGTGGDLFAPRSGSPGPAAPGEAGQDRQRAEAEIINMIKDMIGPDMWQPQGKGSIRILRGQLIISQTALGFKLLDEGAGP
jgi:hypothetical protein